MTSPFKIVNNLAVRDGKENGTDEDSLLKGSLPQCSNTRWCTLWCSTSVKIDPVIPGSGVRIP